MGPELNRCLEAKGGSVRRWEFRKGQNPAKKVNWMLESTKKTYKKLNQQQVGIQKAHSSRGELRTILENNFPIIGTHETLILTLSLLYFLFPFLPLFLSSFLPLPFLCVGISQLSVYIIYCPSKWLSLKCLSAI